MRDFKGVTWVKTNWSDWVEVIAYDAERHILVVAWPDGRIDTMDTLDVVETSTEEQKP